MKQNKTRTVGIPNEECYSQNTILVVATVTETGYRYCGDCNCNFYLTEFLQSVVPYSYNVIGTVNLILGCYCFTDTATATGTGSDTCYRVIRGVASQILLVSSGTILSVLELNFPK